MNKVKHSKRYREISQKIKPNKRCSLNEALKFLQENNQEKSKNIEMAVSLRWNEKKVPLRSQLSLPHPLKKQEKIIILGEELPPALQNKEGIELASGEKVTQLVNKEKKLIVLTHTSYQDKIKPLAKILGPKGMFPNSKNGTLTNDLEKAVKEIQQGKIEIRTDKQGNIHLLLGKTSFPLEQLKKNYEIAYETIKSLKPTSWKGDYIRNSTLSTTMGPGIRVLT
ncbi:MAG: 50S ribosomal protein L1 [Mycoplasmataceae bacterium CE_OT135]|nr:MAG: 50S ribosomal protein L1 [Mycoplasmataceae bacterium CE_OT135]